MQIDLEWRGPYRLVGPLERVIFDVADGMFCGIYLWGAMIENHFHVYYVGETGRTYFDRHVEHVQWYLSGYYPVLDANEYRRGTKKKILDGIGDPRLPGQMTEIIRRHVSAAPKIAEFLGAIEIIVAPMVKTTDRRLRRLVEGAIYRQILRNEGAANFLDESNRYWYPRSDEMSLSLNSHWAFDILGLGSTIPV